MRSAVLSYLSEPIAFAITAANIGQLATVFGSVMQILFYVAGITVMFIVMRHSIALNKDRIKSNQEYLAAKAKWGDTPEQTIRRVHLELMNRLTAETDVVRSAATDLEFLHSQVYPSVAGHECPVCKSTIPAIETLAEQMHSIRISTAIEPDTDAPDAGAGG